MNHKSTLSIPEPIAQLQRQLDQFRITQSQRTKLPESLWQAAVELARQHGVYAVAHPLRLDYMGLFSGAGWLRNRFGMFRVITAVLKLAVAAGTVMLRPVIGTGPRKVL